MRELMEEVKEEVAELVEDVKESVAEARERVEQFVEAVKERLSSDEQDDATTTVESTENAKD